MAVDVKEQTILVHSAMICNGLEALKRELDIAFDRNDNAKEECPPRPMQTNVLDEIIDELQRSNKAIESLILYVHSVTSKIV